jgi:hypothetical protein
MIMYSHCMFMYDYPDWGFSVLFPQLQGKCLGKTRKDGARTALFLIVVLFYVFFVLFYVFLCCSMCFYVVLCIVCFVTFPVLFVCICVLNNCYRVATQLQLNISYHILQSCQKCVCREDRRNKETCNIMLRTYIYSVNIWNIMKFANNRPERVVRSLQCPSPHITNLWL